MKTLRSYFKFSKKQIGSLSMVFAFEIICISFICILLTKRQEEAISLDFQAKSVELTVAIEKEISTNLKALTSIKALFSVSDTVSRDQFKTFNKHVLSQIKSIQALEWIPKVPLSDKHLFESKARDDGLENFRITEKIKGKLVPVAKREVYYPVYFVEPMIGNEKALGFDLASNPTRFSALKKAIRMDDLVATSRVTLVQEKSRQKGVLVFSPIKKENEIIGFGLGVFRIQALISRALLQLHSVECDLRIFDLSAEAGDQLLAQLNKSNSPALGDNIKFDVPEGLHYIEKIKIADREWAVLTMPTPAYLKSFSDATVPVLSVFIALSIGILYIVYYLQKDTEKSNSDLKVTDEEDIFLQQMRSLVEENLTNSNFDIKLFAQKAGLSRVQLFRKIKAHTNKSPSIFVRTVRLQNAKTLLLKTDLQIAEIAYDVGFKDPAFFTRSFKKEYGLTPSAFRMAQLI